MIRSFPGRTLYPALAMAAVVGLVTPALALDVGEVELGQPVCGPPVTRADLLTGWVVLVQWSADDPDPLLEIADLCRSEGVEVLIVADCVAQPDPARVEAALDEEDLSCPVVWGSRVGRNQARAGRVFIFEDGREVFSGDADDDLELALERALHQERQPDLDAGLRQRRVQRIAVEAEDRANYDRALRSLERLEGDGAEAEEAAVLAARILRQGRRDLERAERLVEEHPHQAIALLERVEEGFGRHELGQQARQTRRDLERDSHFADELVADRLLEQVLAMLRAWQPCAACGGAGGGLSFDDDEDEADDDDLFFVQLTCVGCRQNNRRAAPSIEAGLASLIRRHADTRASSRAGALARQLNGQGAEFGFDDN
jgi:hypothetical protein